MPSRSSSERSSDSFSAMTRLFRPADPRCSSVVWAKGSATFSDAVMLSGSAASSMISSSSSPPAIMYQASPRNTTPDKPMRSQGSHCGI
jgi:hypothetical protein